MRFGALGIALLATSCPTPMTPASSCSPSTCEGCCEGSVCRLGTADSACGAAGAVCTACNPLQRCRDSACVCNCPNYVAGADPVCGDGMSACGYDVCHVGFSDCDGNRGNGCEVTGSCPVDAGVPDAGEVPDAGVCVDIPCGTLGQPCCLGRTCESSVTACVYPQERCLACGEAGQPCCSDERCGEGRACILMGTAKVCVECGGPDQPCCAGTSCADGGCCFGSSCRPQGSTCGIVIGGGTCANGSCASGACGNLGQACCSGICTHANATCGGLCVHCGHEGEECCPGRSPPCSEVGTYCQSGRCLHCGDAGELCCAGRHCTPQTVCAPLGSTCVGCGQPGQPCCVGRGCGGGCCDGVGTRAQCVAPGGTCSAGDTCQPSGQCSACGGLRQPCCAGNACTDGGTCISGACASCGGPYETPCAGGLCTGAACLDTASNTCIPSGKGVMPGSICITGSWTPCGQTGGPCCEDSTCASDGGCCVGHRCVAAGGSCTGGLGVCGAMREGGCGSCGGSAQSPCSGLGYSDFCTASGSAPWFPLPPATTSCLRCGAPNQPCCPGNACAAGGCCDSKLKTCVAAGAQCSNGCGACMNGKCLAGSCGGLHQAPCPSGVGCTAPGTVENAQGTRCVACGGADQPCCRPFDPRANTGAWCGAPFTCGAQGLCEPCCCRARWLMAI